MAVGNGHPPAGRVRQEPVIPDPHSGVDIDIGINIGPARLHVQQQPEDR